MRPRVYPRRVGAGLALYLAVAAVGYALVAWFGPWSAGVIG